MKILPIIVFPVCAGACVVGWYGFNSLQPKNLKEYLEWQGFKLASSENTWKAIIKEHPEMAKSISVSSESDVSKLESWCSTHLLLEEFSPYIDKASKLCVDNVGTVEAKLVRDGFDLNEFFKESGDDDKYKTSYAFRKHNEDFLSLIGHTPEEEEKDFEPAITRYKEWCSTTLRAKPDPSPLENFKIFCKPKNFSTVSSYLDVFKYTLLADDKLKDKWNEIKGFATYKQDISQDGENGLDQWCKENSKKNFSESLVIFDEILPKVISRCVEGSASLDK